METSHKGGVIKESKGRNDLLNCLKEVVHAALLEKDVSIAQAKWNSRLLTLSLCLPTSIYFKLPW